jgi:hypothetical protein
VGTVTQQRRMSKLLGYDFVIEYKRGKENKVANALSRVFEEPAVPVATICSLISFPSPTWLEELKLSYDSDPGTTELLHKFQLGEDVPKGYMLK